MLGDINWLRPYLTLTTGELKPLFDILNGYANPNSPQQLTNEGQIALQKVEEAIILVNILWTIHYVDYNQLLAVCVLDTYHVLTEVLWQKRPLM